MPQPLAAPQSRAEVYSSLAEHFARYFDACDRGDLDAILEILAGATVVAAGIVTDDPVRIRAAYAANHPAPDQDGRRAVKNHGTNLLLDGPDPDGSWRASLYYFRLEPGDGGGVVTRSGRLEQEVVRDGGRWQVRRHAVLSDF